MYKPVIGSLGAMQIFTFLSPVDASLRWSTIFGLALASTAVLGIGQRSGLSYHIILICPSRLAIFPVSVFNFYKVRFQNLGLLKNLEDFAPFLGVALSIVLV